MTRILDPDGPGIAAAAELIAAGELVGMPTETVYGLAGLAFDEAAVARIFAVKERPTFDPLIVHLPARAALSEVAALDKLHLRAIAALDRLIERFWPGPLTVVLPRTSRVPDLVASGLPTVAVRMPDHPAAQALLNAVGAPLAAPSANRFGRISPTSAGDVIAELGGRIAAVIDGGPCAVGIESTIVSLVGPPTLLRPGAVPAGAIDEALGAPLARGVTPTTPLAAGMLPQHYAPHTPLVLFGDLPASLPAHLGLLVQSGDAEAAGRALAGRTGRRVTAVSLSADGDLVERARRLFACLRALDDSGAGLILAEDCLEEEGLGHAIRDRLRRASSR